MKRARLSSEARAAMGIPDAERIIAWGVADRGDSQHTAVVATDRGLYEQRTGIQIPWQSVIRGTWEQPDLVVDFQGDQGPRRIRIRLEDPRDLPPAVRDRVTESVVVSEYRELIEGAGAHFVARRAPGAGMGDIRWAVVFDAGCDPGDPDLRARADQTLGELRSSLGI